MTSIGGEGRPLQLYNDEIETYSEWIAWLEPAFPTTVFLPSFLPYIRYGSPGSGLFPRIPLLRAGGQENGIVRNRITRHVVVAATTVRNEMVSIRQTETALSFALKNYFYDPICIYISPIYKILLSSSRTKFLLARRSPPGNAV